MTERRKLAKETADYAHATQTRKGSKLPYSIHPHAVAEITAKYTDNEDAVIAAELHDVLEDVSADRYSEQQMLTDFGPDVVKLVKMVSEDKRADDIVQKSWEERKNGYINHLSRLTDRDALIISTADKIHNLSSMIEDYDTIGDDLWTRFNAPKEKQLWYYRQIIDVLETKNLPKDLYRQLSEKVSALSRIINK